MANDAVTSLAEAAGATPAAAWSGRLGQVKAVSPRDAVTEQIIELIRTGTLRPGDRLPSELELMARTGVGRSSVREAIRSLVAMQLVEIQRGRGTFVRQVDAGGITDAQVLLMLADKKSLQDLVEVRQALEPMIVRLAAERATDADVAELRRAVAGMNEARRHAEWRQFHLDFHRALAAATHNVILTKMWSLVQMFLKDSPMVKGRPSPPDVHADLMAAVADHDVARAEAAMRRHLTDMTRVLE